MKFSHVLPLAALSSALVIPQEEVMQDVAIESNHRGNSWFDEAVSSKDEILSGFKQHFDEVTETSKSAWNEASEKSKSALDDAFSRASDAASGFSEKVHETAFDAQSWLESEIDSFNLDDPHHDHPPHHGPPHHGPPHHGKPNQTVYELIAESKYTTKLAKLINDFPDLVKELNSTKANYVRVQRSKCSQVSND